VAILVSLKTIASYNPTSLTPSLFTEVPVLSQESERSCICFLGIYNLPISTIFLLNFWNFSDSVIFFFHFITGCEKRIMMMYRQQGLQKKYCKAEQDCFGAEDRLKLLSKLWILVEKNNKTSMAKSMGHFRDSREFSWLSGPPTDVPDEPPLIGPTLYHTRFCKSSCLSFYKYNIMCFVKHASSKRYC